MISNGIDILQLIRRTNRVDVYREHLVGLSKTFYNYFKSVSLLNENIKLLIISYRESNSEKFYGRSNIVRN